MSVVLRALQPDDQERLLNWRNSPEVSAFMYTDHLISKDEHRRWFAKALGDQTREHWIIEFEQDPVGLASLGAVNPQARRCDWAFYLADPKTRGKGVGACVEHLVICHAFDGLGLNKLWCEVLLENEAVWRMHLGFGFRQEAVFRQHVHKGGGFKDVVGLGLLAEDWAEHRPGVEARLKLQGAIREKNSGASG